MVREEVFDGLGLAWLDDARVILKLICLDISLEGIPCSPLLLPTLASSSLRREVSFRQLKKKVKPSLSRS